MDAAARARIFQSGLDADCTCELQQVQQVQGANAPEALRSCQQDAAPSGLEGWCYVDPARGIGSAELVSSCAASERRRLRLLGSGLAEGASVLLVCPGTAP